MIGQSKLSIVLKIPRKIVNWPYVKIVKIIMIYRISNYSSRCKSWIRRILFLFRNQHLKWNTLTVLFPLHNQSLNWNTLTTILCPLHNQSLNWCSIHLLFCNLCPNCRKYQGFLLTLLMWCLGLVFIPSFLRIVIQEDIIPEAQGVKSVVILQWIRPSGSLSLCIRSHKSRLKDSG